MKFHLTHTYVYILRKCSDYEVPDDKHSSDNDKGPSSDTSSESVHPKERRAFNQHPKLDSDRKIVKKNEDHFFFTSAIILKAGSPFPSINHRQRRCRSGRFSVLFEWVEEDLSIFARRQQTPSNSNRTFERGWRLSSKAN
ncbi:hypothetical protein CEXT_561811 [Caerostris extrusa]|uniref:Ycf15 n=1 Tax=Caerostris extrusa TaxID=172846 RepID=A0AAV4W4C9_CAEEX|nr:hypothetical protein CEXT_561811 [Caerostris extrusa]